MLAFHGHGGRVDLPHRIRAIDHLVIPGALALHVELVLKAGAAAALDADAQHRALALGPENLPDTAGRPLADDHARCCHDLAPIADIYQMIWYPAFTIVKCAMR